MSFAPADLAVFTADGDATVVCGGVTVTGWLRVTDEPIGEPDYADERVLGRMTEVLIVTGALPALALDVAVTVNGTAYQCREFRLVGDGAFTKLYLG